MVNRCQRRRQCRQWRPRNRRPTTTTTYNFFRRIDFLCRTFFRSIFFRPKGQGPGFDERRTTHDERRTTDDASKFQPLTKKMIFQFTCTLRWPAKIRRTDERTDGWPDGPDGRSVIFFFHGRPLDVRRTCKKMPSEKKKRYLNSRVLCAGRPS